MAIFVLLIDVVHYGRKICRLGVGLGAGVVLHVLVKQELDIVRKIRSILMCFKWKFGMTVKFCRDGGRIPVGFALFFGSFLYAAHYWISSGRSIRHTSISWFFELPETNPVWWTVLNWCSLKSQHRWDFAITMAISFLFFLLPYSVTICPIFVFLNVSYVNSKWFVCLYRHILHEKIKYNTINSQYLSILIDTN